MKTKIFKSQEVQAIIEGRKTMFREIIKKTKNEIENYSLPDECGTELLLSEAPYKVGQEIFAKGQEPPITLRITSVKVERLQDISEEDFYKSGVECLHGTEIADTGDYFDDEYYFGELEEESITECDCDGTMELCYKCSCGGFTSGYTLLNTHNNPFDPYIEFWDSTHKKPEEKWEADPWVFVYEFEVVNFKK